ncbi:hypothetical protein LTS10_000317 [Elasticomyces elasticus]|nr:hypothetical protein LTS10_000317 [Elasticomyces elasticus]
MSFKRGADKKKDSLIDIMANITKPTPKGKAKPKQQVMLPQRKVDELTDSTTSMGYRKTAKPIAHVKPPQPAPNDKPFPFEKLPAELRNAVYEIHFVRGKPVEIARRKRPMTVTQKTITTDIGDGVSITQSYPYKTPSEVILNSGELGTSGLTGNKCITLLGPEGASILRASKTINTEAKSILYGSNKFSVKYLACLTEFVRCIGVNIKTLRHCKLDFTHGPHLTIGTSLLEDVGDLRVLEFHVDVARWCNTLDDVYARIGPALVDFISRGKTDAERQGRYGLLQLSIDPNRYGEQGQGLKDHEGQNIKEPARAQDIVIAEIKKRLITSGILKEIEDSS